MKYEDIKKPLELYNFIKDNFTYGFYSKNHDKCFTRDILKENYETTLFNNYCLQTPAELLQRKVGLCYDFVEFEKDWLLKHNYKVYTYYTKHHNHAFLVYVDNGYNLFETTYDRINGIHNEKTLEDIKNYIIKNQKNNIKLYEFSNPIFGSDFYQFVYNITKDKKYIEEIRNKYKVD